MKHSPLHGLGSLLPACTFALGLACEPYGTWNKNGDENLGPVDPVNFPPGNLGVGGDRKRPGRGRFSEITAYVGGQPLGYFTFPVPAVPMGADPLRVQDDGQPYPPVPTPTAYVFDATDNDPFPTDNAYPCTPPSGYAYDQMRDEVDFSQQGNVLSALPSATYTEGVAATSSYVPVVAEASLTSRGRACQKLKSEALIESALGADRPLSGRYLAWLVIDPSAPVYPRDVPTGVYPAGHPMEGQSHSGMGLQRWGWYNRFLGAYLDGGYIPTEDVMVTMPAPRMVKRMKPQRLFIPRQVAGAMMTMAAGRAGAGYDVLEFKRGEAGYSPLCQVWVYGDTMMPPPTAATLPKNAKDILDAPALNAAAAMPASYVYCLQVR